jgi:hypothetical protein
MRTLTHRLGVFGAAAAFLFAPALTAPAHALAGAQSGSQSRSQTPVAGPDAARTGTATATGASTGSDPIQVYGKFTGSVYVGGQSQVLPECNDFAASLQDSTSSWVESVAPAGAGGTNGMLGYMFWAAGSPSVRGKSTFPPNTCAGGVGVGATSLGVPVPMPALRQN